MSEGYPKETLVMYNSDLPASFKADKCSILTLGELPVHTGDAADREVSKLLESGRGDVDVTILAGLTPVDDSNGGGLALVRDGCSLAADAAAVEVAGSQGSNAVTGGVESTAGDLVAGAGIVVGHLADFGGGNHNEREHGECVEHHFDGGFG